MLAPSMGSRSTLATPSAAPHLGTPVPIFGNMEWAHLQDRETVATQRTGVGGGSEGFVTESSPSSPPPSLPPSLPSRSINKHDSSGEEKNLSDEDPSCDAPPIAMVKQPIRILSEHRGETERRGRGRGRGRERGDVSEEYCSFSLQLQSWRVIGWQTVAN